MKAFPEYIFANITLEFSDAMLLLSTNGWMRVVGPKSISKF
jgi:hypothetical protein